MLARVFLGVASHKSEWTHTKPCLRPFQGPQGNFFKGYTMNQLLKPKQVAALLNCSLSSVYDWAAQGTIPALKLNGCLRFDPDEVEEWVRQGRLKPEDIDRRVRKILKPAREVDVNAVVRKAIDSSKRSDIIPFKGKPDLNRAQGKGGSSGAL